MPNMFVKKTDFINIKVYVWETDTGVDATNEKGQIPKDKDVTEVNFKFKRPSYDDSRKIMSVANVDSEQNIQVDPTEFQDRILKNLLKEWDIKDENENIIPCTSKHINNLEPVIARSAVSGIMDVIEL